MKYFIHPNSSISAIYCSEITTWIHPVSHVLKGNWKIHFRAFNSECFCSKKNIYYTKVQTHLGAIYLQVWLEQCLSLCKYTKFSHGWMSNCFRPIYWLSMYVRLLKVKKKKAFLNVIFRVEAGKVSGRGRGDASLIWFE